MEFDDLLTFTAEELCKRRTDPELCVDVCSVCQTRALAIFEQTANYLQDAGMFAAAATLRADVAELQEPAHEPF
jgi:hypothetical protein